MSCSQTKASPPTFFFSNKYGCETRNFIDSATQTAMPLCYESRHQFRPTLVSTMHIPTLVRHPFSEGRPAKNRRRIFFLLGVRISKKKKRTEKTDRCWKMSATFFFRKFRWATFKTLLIFRYTDWLVEVLIMAYYTPYIIGQYNLLYTANFEKHCWQVAESARYLIGRASVSKLKFACLTLTHRDPKTKTPPKNTKRNMMKHVFFSKSTGLQGKVYK